MPPASWVSECTQRALFGALDECFWCFYFIFLDCYLPGLGLGPPPAAHGAGAVPLRSAPHRPGGAERLSRSSQGAFLSLYCGCRMQGGCCRRAAGSWGLGDPFLSQCPGMAAVRRPGVLQSSSLVLPFGIALPCVPRRAQPRARGRDPLPQPRNSPLHPRTPGGCGEDVWSPVWGTPAPGTHLGALSPAGRSPRRTPPPAPSSPARGGKEERGSPGGGGRPLGRHWV